MAIKQSKKELAELAIQLFDNIDQADQFDVYALFYHCDRKYLLWLIEDLLGVIKQNKGRFVLVSEDRLAEIIEEAQKVLGVNYENQD